jgi:predicted RNA methylase
MGTKQKQRVKEKRPSQGRKGRSRAAGDANLRFDFHAEDDQTTIQQEQGGYPPDVAIQFDSRTAAMASTPSPYDGFYLALSNLREAFHRVGRFDDANAKLDELCKLLVLKVLDRRHPSQTEEGRLSLAGLRRIAQERFGDPGRLARALHAVFAELANEYTDEIESFGPRPALSLDLEDDEFAEAVVPLLDALPCSDEDAGAFWSFDAFNEAFGHFIQDSFRNRKEDAQYMTPPEVVTPVVEMAFLDCSRDGWGNGKHSPFIVADPTCGVGSFLAAAYRRACTIKTAGGSLVQRLRLFGQDKVDRMVRLSNVNLRVFAQATAQIRQGNSILPANGLDDLQGNLDLILTNPPFGATFKTADILCDSEPRHYPTLFQLAGRGKLPYAIDSEFLLLDRELALLRPGGRIFMVVPDKVVSASGFPEVFREALLARAHLAAVLDLPTETFAQAGTRTKTSVVYLQRHRDRDNGSVRRAVFMGKCEDIGFRVVSRTGVTVKKITGPGDLPTIVEKYRTFDPATLPRPPFGSINRSPSVAVVAENRLLNNRWNAGFYRRERWEALSHLDRLERCGFCAKELPSVVDVDPEADEQIRAGGGDRCISVLHVREDGFIDIQAVEHYAPTSPCVRCRTGDVLLSRINPRILRVCVVPEAEHGFGCSSEFAVLRCREKHVSPWMLAMILRSSVVQEQIRTLTSGTSSSHSRIKTKDLAAVVLPVPKRGGRAFKRLSVAAESYENASREYYAALMKVLKCFDESGRAVGDDT